MSFEIHALLGNYDMHKQKLEGNFLDLPIIYVRYCTVFSFIVLLYCESYIYKSNM